MNRFKSHKLWIITLLLSLPVIVVAAVPNMFQAGTVISSAQVNANFAALDARITTLETAIQNSGATVVFDNMPGALPQSMAFSSKGGPLLLILSGSAYLAGAGHMGVTAQLDAKSVGTLSAFTNEPNSHKAFPTRVLKIAPAAAGAHTLILLPDPTTLTDTNDPFSVTVVELAH
jgi:hypothetical protein